LPFVALPKFKSVAVVKVNNSGVSLDETVPLKTLSLVLFVFYSSSYSAVVMSYRLFKDRKNGRKPGGGFLAAKPKATSAPASSRFLNRTTVGRGGRSGAQMQIQRPAVQQHAVRQQDEQQQRVHGISMAEGT
jgi:hypothetical protein